MAWLCWRAHPSWVVVASSLIEMAAWRDAAYRVLPSGDILRACQIETEWRSEPNLSSKLSGPFQRRNPYPLTLCLISCALKSKRRDARTSFLFPNLITPLAVAMPIPLYPASPNTSILPKAVSFPVRTHQPTPVPQRQQCARLVPTIQFTHLQAKCGGRLAQ